METLWHKAKGSLKWQPAAVLKTKNFQTAVFLLKNIIRSDKKLWKKYY